MTGSFTDQVRQELAGLPLPDGEQGCRSELAALVRCGGSLIRVGGASTSLRLRVETTSGGTARRAYALLDRLGAPRPRLWVRAAGGVQRRTVYGVEVDDAHELALSLAVVDGHGRPAALASTADAYAAHLVRGAFLGGGSLSAPGRPPHLELGCRSATTASALAEAVRTLIGGHVSVSEGGERCRVVCKSGAAIGDLLTVLGATGAFLRFDERRLRRQLRADATRLANADAANLRRSVSAAAAQVAAVERLVAAHGWEGLDDDVRAVALARLTSPEASLTELGQLTDPPLSRSAVHRRLARLLRDAAALDRSDPQGPDQVDG